MNTSRSLELSTRLAALGLDKQQLFRQKLAEQGIDSWSLPIVPFKPVINQSNADDSAEAPLNKLAAYPLSLAQQRFLVAEQMSERSLYNLCSILHFDAGLDTDILQQAIGQLVQRHQILRTHYQQNQQGLWQPILAETNNISVDTSGEKHIAVDINRHASGLQHSHEVEDWCQSEYENQLSKAFDLACELPFRVDLYSHIIKTKGASQAGGFFLFFTIHHIAFDAWSAQQLIKELSIIYRLLQDSPPRAIDSALPTLAIQYQDYAAWQNQWLNGSAYSQQQQYWQKQLRALPEPLVLPRDYQYKENQQPSYEGAIERYQFSPNLSQALRKAVKAQGTTLYNYLQTAFACLVEKYTGQLDFCLGTSVANRDRAELSELIGPLLNTLVIRHKLDKKASFEQSLKQTQQVVAAAFDNKDYPFEHLAKIVPRERTITLFTIMFVQVALPETLSITLPDTQIQLVQAKQKHARFDLTLRITESPETINLELEYATELFTQQTIQQWLAHLEEILEQVSKKPSLVLSDIHLSTHLSRIKGPLLREHAVLLTDKIRYWSPA